MYQAGWALEDKVLVVFLVVSVLFMKVREKSSRAKSLLPLVERGIAEIIGLLLVLVADLLPGRPAQEEHEDLAVLLKLKASRVVAALFVVAPDSSDPDVIQLEDHRPLSVVELSENKRLE